MYLRDEIVDEPRRADGEKVLPIPSDDKPVRCLRARHRVFLVPGWFFHVQPPEKDENSGDDTEAQGEPPHSS